MFFTTTHDALLRQFGRPVVLPAEVLPVFGRTPSNPESAARLSIARSRFPCRVIKIGGRLMVDLRDLAESIDAAYDAARDDAAQHGARTVTPHVPAAPAPASAQRGRPKRKTRTRASAGTAATAGQRGAP